jgi:TPR repeat protein
MCKGVRLMKKLVTTICLTISVLLGSAGMSWSADFQKGFTAYKSGNYETALREWTPLAEQGDNDLQFLLGAMYEKGEGVPQDDKTAVKWYRLAAEQGYAAAQSNLGIMYSNGQGVPQDDKAAVKWYLLSAEQGYASAQSSLGYNYYVGTGVIKDKVYAHMWWSIAASRGDKNAIKNRGVVEGEMTPSQLETAEKLARECIRKKYKGC